MTTAEPLFSRDAESLCVRPDRQYDPHYRYKMSPLDSSIDNRNKQRKTHLHNVAAVARDVFRPEGWLIKYLALRLSTDCGRGADGSAAYLTGHHDAAQLQQFVFGFIQEYVLCKCGSPETLLYVEGKKRRKTAKLRCHSCGRDGKAKGQEEKMLNLFDAQPMPPELCPMLRGDRGAMVSGEDCALAAVADAAVADAAPEEDAAAEDGAAARCAELSASEGACQRDEAPASPRSGSEDHLVAADVGGATRCLYAGA